MPALALGHFEKAVQRRAVAAPRENLRAAVDGVFAEAGDLVDEGVGLVEEAGEEDAALAHLLKPGGE